MLRAKRAPDVRQVTVMEEQSEFRNQLRDALAHLYDQAHLECHPLVSQLLQPGGNEGLSRAQVLRSMIKEAIDELRPRHGDPSIAPEWRSYLALHCRYIRSMALLEVEDELGISRRQLQREERKGIDALASVLWNRRTASGPAMRADTEEPDGDLGTVRNELAHWKLNRQVCTVESLVKEACHILRPLMEQQQASLNKVTVPPSLKSVFVDPTLTRQVLVTVLRMLIQRGEGTGITLRASSTQGSANMVAVEIIATNPAPSTDVRAEDWDVAALLIKRQGGYLRWENASGDTRRFTLGLPVASQDCVLVIDDVEAVHRLFERYLASANCEVVGVADGTKALDVAVHRQPDVIVLDVMIPRIDGWQILRNLKGDPATASIPVVVCSVLDEPDVALSLGAYAFIRKPVDRQEMVSLMRRIRAARQS